MKITLLIKSMDAPRNYCFGMSAVVSSAQSTIEFNVDMRCSPVGFYVTVTGICNWGSGLEFHLTLMEMVSLLCIRNK